MERVEWKGLPARLRNILRHWLRAGRDLERKERGLAGLLLGPAARLPFSLRRVVSAFLTSLLRRERAEGWVSGKKEMGDNSRDLR